MYQHVKNEKGLTLLELLIVMMILSFVMVAMFQVIDVNYATMRDALEEQETRDNLRVFNAHLMQDIVDAPEIGVQNETAFDVLMYTDYQGNARVVKFAHGDGIYEVENGEEKLIVKADKPENSDKPMVYEEDGLIYVNAYAKEVNTLLDFALAPRVRE